jgi:hypothetical protein
MLTMLSVDTASGVDVDCTVDAFAAVDAVDTCAAVDTLMLSMLSVFDSIDSIVVDDAAID